MGKLRTEWLALATQDAALFYVALSHYAGNYSLANNQSDPMEALRFRMESMKLINSRLEDINNALTDGTLGTVASLSSYEVRVESSAFSSIGMTRNGTVTRDPSHVHTPNTCTPQNPPILHQPPHFKPL
jgi:hypothetical protein